MMPRFGYDKFTAGLLSSYTAMPSAPLAQMRPYRETLLRNLLKNV
jgi:hypothetical protein